MNNHLIMEELLGLLESHGIKTRKDALNESTGGLCKINGEQILFLDKDAQTDRLTALCADAVIKLIDIDTIYLKPETREFIERRIAETCNENG